MTRTLRDLTADEKSAYRIWQAKLADRTLSAEQHDQARREIDNILWKGPNAQVMALKAEIAALEARLERCEFHLGLRDDLVTAGYVPTNGGDAAGETYISPRPDGLSQSVTVDVTTPARVAEETADAVAQVRDELGDAAHPPAPETEVEAPVAEEAAAGETRGRKKLRFIPDRNASKEWLILDREGDGGEGEFLDTAPFRTRKDTKVMTDELNAGRIPKCLLGKVNLSEGVIVTEETAAGEELGVGRCGLPDVEDTTGEGNPHDVENAPDDGVTDADLGF